MRKKKIGGIAVIVLIVIAGIAGCYFKAHYEGINVTGNQQNSSAKKTVVDGAAEKTESQEKAPHYINAEGRTLEGRILTPEGYVRTKEAKNSLAAFLRKYKMKKDESPVLLYDGREKAANVHVAVFKLPLENEDLQQCADSVMRVYGEYYYSRKKYDRIEFSLGGGFRANFEKWSQGNGIGIRNDTLYWMSSPENDRSYSSFRKFMRIVFAYSGTLNLEEDSEKIKLKDIQVGDVFLKGGSPGHVVMVVDMCENSEGNKAFLLAQGYMPAQEFHVIKNPLHEENPWYYQNEISYPLETAEYTFEKGSLRRLKFR